MSDAAAASVNAGAELVREGIRFNDAALARRMAGQVEGFAGPLTVVHSKGGHSNPTQ